MIDPASAALLQEIFRREARSLLMYVGEAFPWTMAKDGAAIDRLQTIFRAEAQSISALGRFLARQHVPPASHGSYPASFTTSNFVALDYLLPRLIENERSSIPALEAARDRLADSALAVVTALLDVKRKNLAALEELAAAHLQPATV